MPSKGEELYSQIVDEVARNREDDAIVQQVVARVVPDISTAEEVFAYIMKDGNIGLQDGGYNGHNLLELLHGIIIDLVYTHDLPQIDLKHRARAKAQ